MLKSEFGAKLTRIVVENNWDLPTAGREVNLDEVYHGPDHAVREAMKQEGRRLSSSSTDIDDVLIGYGLEAYGHYYYSLESAVNNNRLHAYDFEDYFSHWIYSDPNYFPSDVFKVFQQWFLKPSIIKIQKGKVLWIIN
jgi:hypothetical protein